MKCVFRTRRRAASWWLALSVIAGVIWMPIPAAGDTCTAMSKPVGEPQLKGSVDAAEHTRLCRDGYVLSHNNERRVPNWVVERLKPRSFSGPADRDALGNPFAEDPDLKARDLSRATLADYRGSGLDRGHMAPAADMKYSEEAMTESFYLSNMAPQVGIGLNRHIWADLEKLTRQWTCDIRDTIVISGPVFGDTPKKMKHKVAGKMVDTDIALPDGFYKILYDPKRMRVLGFLLPNKKIDTKGRPPEEALKPFIRSIHEIEAEAGIEFLPGLSARDARRIKALRPPMWNVRKGCTGNVSD